MALTWGHILRLRENIDLIWNIFKKYPSNYWYKGFNEDFLETKYTNEANWEKVYSKIINELQFSGIVIVIIFRNIERKILGIITFWLSYKLFRLYQS
jgi:hypothetical protein